jgi:dTDP-glucose 4,6-dehydratase
MKKRILVTGGAGFVAHHAIEALLKRTDWEIVVLDVLSYAGNLNRLLDIRHPDQERRIKFVWHDLKAPISLTTHSFIGNVDYVWHFAAESHVENSLQNPELFAYNVVATTNLLNYLRKHQYHLKRYIGFNTDEVFGPAPKGVFFKEDDKFYPSNPYSASKAGQWAMEYAFYRSFRMPISMVHSMNIFGERQHPEKFIPMAVRKLLSWEKITLHGKVDSEETSSRCWIHAREVANALLFLLDRAQDGQTYNVVGHEMSVFDLANIICKTIRGKDLSEGDYTIEDVHSQRPGHDFRYALSG